ncbi:AraC family transcriptional regulator [Thalassotalea sp. HSM 43]|uniref:AraC family transcriptional regulator n=1 Tax=Thalassotalea sp. HSM 43 TaxID=2552945 RepID=UPI001080AD55|nr:AraC family transcriptional regulator [Thalassotalea sp. HSM 43]QBY03110.1 AraC family transcriptional regulator [Thalassotalea sp. HSM 43]
MNQNIQSIIASVALSTMALLGSMSTASAQSPDEDLQTFKGGLVDMAADIKELELAVLYPDADQLAVYLSIDAADTFNVTAITLMVDGEKVHSALYTEYQQDALRRGGVDRVFLGDVEVGEHQIIAYISGTDARGRKTKRGVATTFIKAADANAIELKVGVDTSSNRPTFVATEL